MALIPMSDALNPSLKTEYPAADFYFGDAYDNASQSGLSIRKVHQADLQEPYLGICFQVDNLTFVKDDIRYTLLEGINEATPLTDTPIKGTDIVSHEGQYNIAFNDSLFTAVPTGIKPDDFDALKDICYYTKDSDGYKPGYVTGQWEPLVQYYKCSKNFTMRYNVAGTGTIDFSFGIRTTIGSTEFGYSNVWSGPNASTFRLTDYDQYSTPYYMNQIGSTNHVNYFAVSVGGIASKTYTGPYVETFPVSFSIPKGFVLNGYTIPYAATYYGTISITYSDNGIPQQAWVQALEKKCWITEQNSHGSMGDDTPVYGGKGKQPVARDNPKGTIRKAKSAGILSDPTSGSGVVIYKFTEAQFTDFLSKLSNWEINTIQGFTDQNTLLSNFFASKGNLDNILFIKKSPINFPSYSISLDNLAVGSMNIANVNCAVVTEWYKEGTFTINPGAEFEPNTFRDLEPYAAGEIYFPLAGSIAVPPTYLANSTMTIDYGFDLLGEGANYSITLKDADSGYTTFSVSGQCCKDANIFIPGRNVKEAFQSIMPLVGAGVMTVATGGISAPALTTTAAGAATGFVENITDLSVTNLPHSGSSQPYDDCITGGRTNVFLYLIKSEPFSSGEEDKFSGRAKLEGYFSNFYVPHLIDIMFSQNELSFVSVSNIDLGLQEGMTKAEFDKIVSYLKEGVWL